MQNDECGMQNAELYQTTYFARNTILNCEFCILNCLHRSLAFFAGDFAH